MLIQRILNQWGKNALCRPCAGRSPALAALILLAGFLAGCGGSKSANTAVAQVLVSPASASLVAGQVLTILATAVNSANANVAATFTFNSSNVSVATISPRGEVCGGIWDSTFVVCNGTNALGNPVSGSATITVTAGGVTSGPITIAVHPSVTSVSVDPIPPGTCLSVAQTHQFTAHAFHNGSEITSSVGNFTWSVSDATVATVDTNGLGTARVPGVSGIVAGIGSTTSPAVSFKTCMPALLSLHLAGDVGTPTTSVTLNTSDTKTLLADMIDEKGSFISPAPITVFSTNAIAATNAGGTIT
ncbi:MAG TPA: Ig-like domain-containing protein, partial [Candidatus Angelobacter sp.]|nr:Ig-like domain-containing protein [Candidatus Angelobacter sp.]